MKFTPPGDFLIDIWSLMTVGELRFVRSEEDMNPPEASVV